MSEANYTIKMNRQEINEVATALQERREKLAKEMASLHPNDTAKNGYAKTLGVIDTLRMRVG